MAIAITLDEEPYRAARSRHNDGQPISSPPRSATLDGWARNPKQ
ncbi:hypothetical protein [Streptomyces cacaoi]